VAVVRTVSDAPSGAASEQPDGMLTPSNVQSASRTASPWWTNRRIALVSATTLVAIGLAAWMLRRPPTAPQVVRFIVPAPEGTTMSPSASSPAVSPNGRWVAFLAARPGEETRVWIRGVDALPARELAGTDGALAPFWSPDSRYIGFFARQQLKIVSLLGEPPSTVCDVQSGHIFAPSATWNDDGVILFSQADAIFRIASTGGKPAAVTSLDARRGETAHILPQFLPDGRHFIYLARGTTGGSINSWIVLGSLDGSEHLQLIRAFANLVCRPRLPRVPV
jgi:hypothetical protein